MKTNFTINGNNLVTRFTNIMSSFALSFALCNEDKEQPQLEINFNPVSFINSLPNHQCEILAWHLINRVGTTAMQNWCLDYEGSLLEQNASEANYEL